MNLKNRLHIQVITIITVILLVFLIPVVGCKAGRQEDELNVYVWEGYLPESVAELFKEETNIKLNVNLMTDNASVYTLLKGGGMADIIMPTQNQVNRFYTDGLALALDMKRIDNYENVSDAFKNQKWSMWDGKKMGSGDTYVIPYIFGTSGIIINTDKYDKKIDDMGWEILFEQELKGRTSARNSAESIMICLDLMGIPREELLEKPEETLKEVRPKVLELKDNVLKFYNTGAELLDMLGNEEVWVSHIWDGGARKMAASDPKFVYVLPNTGGFGWTDTFMIPSVSGNPKGAHEFIDFMLRSEVAAMIVTESGYTTTVRDSIDLAEGIEKDLYLFEDKEIAGLVWQLNFPEDVVDKYNSFWEELSTVE